MNNWRGSIILALSFLILIIFILGYTLQNQSGIFKDFEASLLSVQWMLPACISVWCSTFLFLTLNLNDLPLIGLLLIAMAAYFIGYTGLPPVDAIILLAGITLGKGVKVSLKSNRKEHKLENRSHKLEIGHIPHLRSLISDLRIFLIGLVMLLAFSAWWHLDVSNNYYRGPRWMGLWDNPNVYGMLMGAGVVLAIGLLAHNSKLKIKKSKSAWFLLIAAGMMGVGLVMSYSRGAWVGTAVGLLYLAWSYGKLKWKYVVTGFGLLALGILLIWGRTSDSAPWYVKRADLSRPSAQHRVAAWRGAVQMIWDHPFGVGWNKAIGVYDKKYSPPEGGAGAITMNSYLMLGTELGLPGLVCFVAYVALCLRSPKPKVQSPKSKSAREDARPTNRQDACATLDIGHRTLDSSKTTCRAGAVMLLVAFWFDGGLFTLATASVFWVLLELSQMRSAECGLQNEEVKEARTSPHPDPLPSREERRGNTP